MHTPGPWTARKSRGLNAYEVRGADDSYIGDVWGVDEPVPNGIKREHQKDNARLIAAAPDLLASCKELREALAAAFRVIAGATQAKADIQDELAEAFEEANLRDGVGVRAQVAIAKAENK